MVTHLSNTKKRNGYVIRLKNKIITNSKTFSMKYLLLTRLNLSLFCLFLLGNMPVFAQNPLLNVGFGNNGLNCTSEQQMQIFLENPENQHQHNAIEEQIQRYFSDPNRLQTRAPNALVTLPVVVHVIHNGGTENISDAQVLQGIQDLNDAFANRGYYDPRTGVTTDIAFCLAQRDPNNQATNGITRDVSPLTDMILETQDVALKDINRWQPRCYINIWLVKEINSNSAGSGVAGYAYLPSAHGSNVDGIVMEARWFGSSPANSTVVVHEMGHYLGLYHTFQGSCRNNNCLTDGDQVCDTPPDQSRGVGCNPNANSCTTDADDPSVNNPFRAVSLGGRGDVADLGEDYMDYSPFSCYSVFTQGQKDRMQWFIQNVRSSLLACKSCELPCPSPVTAAFTPRGQTVNVGTTLNFNNISTNGTSYKWRVGAANFTTPNISYLFNTIGTFKVALDVSNTNALCSSATDSVYIQVVCAVSASISPTAASINPNTTVNFTATVQNATTYQWKINGVVVGNALTLNYNFTTAGNYNIEFTASNGSCSVSQTAIVVVNGSQACNNPLFAKTYRVQQGRMSFFAARLETNNNYVAVGSISKMNGASGTDPFIAKFDATGNVLWSKRMLITPVSTVCAFADVKITSDGSYIVGGIANNQPIIAKFSSTGTVEWIKRSNDGGNGDSYFRSIIQTQTGDYVASGALNSTTDAYVAKFSATGATQWVRKMGSSEQDWSVGLDEFNDGNLLVAANTTSSTNTYLMKLSVADGSTLWQKQYTSGASNPCCDHSFDEITKTPDGNFLVVGNWQSGVGLLQKIDVNGTILWARTISNAGQSLRTGHSFQTADGGYICSQIDYNNQLKRTIVKLDANFNTQWVKKIGNGDDIAAKGVLPLSDGNYLFIASENGNLVMKKSDAIATNCEPLETGNVTIRTAQSRASDGTFSNSASGSFSTPAYEIVPLSILIDNRCLTCPVACDSCIAKGAVKILGVDTICYNNTTTYSLKGYKCSKFKTVWTVSGNGITTVSRTDTTITLRFLQGTTLNLKAIIQDSCSSDTITINTHVIGIAPILELGPDKSICQTGVFTLRAGRGFKSYLWQDQSVDSIFTAFGVGKYWVQVIDSCGNIQSDTVRITQSPSPNFNISPDTLRVCEGDKTEVTAPTGFATYRWFPSVGVSDTFQRRVTLTPSVSTKYYCVVATDSGCVNIDSIWIQVNPLNKTFKTGTICQGQTYKLGDSTFIKTGVYDVKIKSTTGGCDTLTRLTLTVINNIPQELSETVCAFRPLKIGDSTYSKAGKYTLILRGRLGSCDTVLTLALTPAESNCVCNIFIPNAFSPFTSLNINDIFYPYGDDCAKEVLLFQIYDRWGELIFNKKNLPLNDVASGWNGTFNGRELNPAVYVYLIDIQLIDGSIKRFVGDVTLVR